MLDHAAGGVSPTEVCSKPRAAASASPSGRSQCAEHVQQLGSESLLSNL